jgi:hypothetical protein
VKKFADTKWWILQWLHGLNGANKSVPVIKEYSMAERFIFTTFNLVSFYDPEVFCTYMGISNHIELPKNSVLYTLAIPQFRQESLTAYHLTLKITQPLQHELLLEGYQT